ncbi:hypothetical protein [Cellulosilyticum sp. I15G10I2]|uniref:hypothetical protein n=1 Tax=Cellulosilyticum sp. I15G10I2 TaxID=1892843 RepID=UPI00085C7976|nr:hypothetical protein [Cellulosilyticum sp. I15G10I2]
MRALRSFIATLLILIIIGGLGYVGYSAYFMGGMNNFLINIPQTNQPPSNNEQMPTQNNTEQSTVVPNAAAAGNRETLTEAIGLINQAIDLITVDPYSKTTLPDMNNGSMQMEGMQGQQGQPSSGTPTINIYPNGNSSVTITPSENQSTDANNQVPAVTNQGAMSGMSGMTGMAGMDNMQQGQNNFVYDQDKLQQLHNGIFTLAQGVMFINQLNEELFAQSTMVEASPANYQTYIIRYNTALQNRNKLSNAINMLTQASVLVNVNPYAPPNGYSYNSEAMKQLHQGVYKLAQGMALLDQLNQEFGNQMINAGVQVQSLNSTSNPTAVDYGSTASQGIFTNMNFTTIFNIILVILLISLIIGVLGGIINMLSPRNKKSEEITSKFEGEPDV